MGAEQESFRKSYSMFEPIIRRVSKKFSAASGIPEEEYISQLSEEFWLLFNKFDSTRGASFSTWANLNLRSKAIQISKGKERTFYRRSIPIRQYGTSSNEDESSYEIADEYNLEQTVLDRLHRKKEADKRQLIDFLLESTTDSVTTAIVTNFPRYKSITALAKALGLHHEVVKRKLRALSRLYDANRFGDYHDYLAV